MKIEAKLVSDWPAAAWFAEWSAGEGRVKVLHGPDVEVRGDRLFEGVWEGSFEAGDFDKASAFCGTGFVLSGGDLHLIPPFHPQERIYYSHDLYPDRRCASNSLLCWLTLTGEELDLNWPDYYADLLEVLRAGHQPDLPSIPLAKGRKLHVVELSGWSTREGKRMAPRVGPSFQGDFEGYRAFLLGQIQALMRNASERPRPKSSVTALSTGFDSVAISSLAKEAGVQKALTVIGKEDAREIGQKLGLEIVAKHADSLTVNDEQREFFVHAFGLNRSMSMFEAHHHNAVLFSGHGGDEMWECTSAFKGGQNLERPRDHILAGNSYSEYRIRIGLVVVPTCMIGQWHWKTVQDISNGESMKPYCELNGQYSRPIARRMGLDAGLNWQDFARAKAKGEIILPDAMLPSDEASYRRFLQEKVQGDLSRSDYEPWAKYHGSPYRWTPHWATSLLRNRYRIQ